MSSRARLAAGLAALVVVGACGGSPRDAARPSAAPSPSPAGPTATPALASVPSDAPVSCRLPVASGDAPVDGRRTDGTAGRGGFVQFPAATFSADPASLGAYDRGPGRWVPVLRAWLSPDGARYAWGEYRTASGPATGTIHVIDVATGADHPVDVPAPSIVVSYESDGVYVARVTPGSGAPPQGLVLVAPSAPGGFHQVIADGTWTAVGGGFAFGQDLDPSVPSPTSAGPNAANRVRRLDLHSGAVSVVGTYPGADAQVLGVSGSTPVIGVTSGAGYAVLMGAGTVFTGPAADTNPGGPIVVDGSTTWFSSQHGAIWRWDGTDRARQVATIALTSPQVVGGCH